MDLHPQDIISHLGDAHVGTSEKTPICKDGFLLTDDEKIRRIERNFRDIMLTLGLDLTDDSLSGTPNRVAKMYVKELFSGLNPCNLPKATLFENRYQYHEMLVERNIQVHSVCEHHFVPIIGVAHVAYISSGKVIGLSKLNRIVRHFAKRPQVQERLTTEVGKHLQQVLQTDDVAVVVDANHYCVIMRGVEDSHSSTVTSFYGGAFQEDARRKELFDYLHLPGPKAD